MKNISGYLAMIAACIVWGNFVLVFHALNFVPVFDIVAHRVIWGFATLLIWLGYKGRIREWLGVMRDPKELKALVLSAALVGVNWAAFVFASGHGYALQAGLGYFIYPLVSITFGAFINHEKLDALQRAAIGLAGVAVLILSIGVGQIPWVALFIAVSFASYGLVKSRLSLGAVMSVMAENTLLLPVALIWLFGFADYGLSFGGNMQAGIGLIFAGVMTALALIWFSYSAKTIGLTNSGMLFFLNPVLQVLNAAFVLGEPLTIWHKTAFPMIGVACAIYCYNLWRRGHPRVASPA